MEGQDPFPGSWVFRRLFVDSNAFSMKVNLIVEGQPVHLQRTIKCQKYIASYKAGMPWLPQYGWEAAERSFGKKLDDGSAIFVVTPSSCNSRRFSELQGDLIRQSEYLPLIVWTRDVVQRDGFEAYVASDFYKGSGARVQIAAAQMSDAIGPVDGSGSSGLDWIDRGVRPYTKYRRSTPYVSLYALAVPEKFWAANRAIADRLLSITEPTLLDSRFHREIQAFVLEQDSFGLLWEGGGVPHGIQSPALARVSGQTGEKLVFRSFDGIRPLRIDAGHWILSKGEAGVLVFYRAAPTSPSRAELESVSRLSFLFGGKTFDRPAENYSVYDPDEKMLYVIRSRTVLLPAKNLH
jgi:hypothetical protein